MKQYKIIEDETNLFMNKLLRENIFNNFQVRDIDIRTFTDFKISGVNLKSDEANDKITFITWNEIKNYIINIIKGKELPKHIKIIFSIPDEALEKIHPNASSLFINLIYENKQVSMITGVSQKNFEMNKSLDDAWENFVINFFKKNDINIKEI